MLSNDSVYTVAFFLSGKSSHQFQELKWGPKTDSVDSSAMLRCAGVSTTDRNVSTADHRTGNISLRWLSISLIEGPLTEPVRHTRCRHAWKRRCRWRHSCVTADRSVDNNFSLRRRKPFKCSWADAWQRFWRSQIIATISRLSKLGFFELISN